MINRQQIQEIPGALRLTLEKAHAEFGAVIRKVRWGDGPIYVCGAGDCAPLSIAASYALEHFLGLPVVARPVEVFQTYSHSLLEARSVLVMIAAKGEWPEALELARDARERGCILVVVTNTPDSSLAALAHHAFLIPAEGDAESPSAAVCLHAGLNFLGFEAMRVLKKPKPWWELVAKDFDLLPEKLDWVFTQLPSAVRSMAAEVARLPNLRIVGGGFYDYPARHAAHRLRFLAGLPVEAIEAAEFLSGLKNFARHGDTVLFLSGSQAKIKTVIHRSAAQARMNGARVLSLTDSNDRDLAVGSDLGILVPSLAEAPASTLAMFTLEWLMMEAQRAKKA